MEKYQNRNGDSGILSYEIKNDSILIKFTDATLYLYTYQSTGRKKVEVMKRLAKKGKGLCTFINKYVRNSYAEKLN